MTPAGPAVRRLHRVLGLALALPLLLWAATGFLFHVKPGWDAAYAPLELPLEPLVGGPSILLGSPVFPADAGWLEARRVRTRLGDHLLVRGARGREHLDARTLQPFPRPDDATLEPLVELALAADPARYGRIVAREDGAFVTDTGARVELDWETLRLSQSGRDTRRIDLLYRIHYLQWTGVPAIDRPLALVGLAALAALALVGLRLARR